ncbi:hypothetical protein ALC62_02126 [Cyphomyrmex costatus]|uniref:Uncharacterized protein n=1 Tax=Cyphomyrmex costatus TaxID=456900 RepID=A0A195D219_9HYME|nr:hypothetical protein ALC62_02126 [Cyphomyrmex costatus]
MGGQWLRRRGEKEQKGIGDDRLEKTVSGRYRGREVKRGYWRASDINLKALQVAREKTDIKGYPTDKRNCSQAGRQRAARARRDGRKWINEGVKDSLESTCKPQRRATAVTWYLGGVGDERSRCNTDVSHRNSQTDNVRAERVAVTGLLHIPARASKRALRLPEVQPRVSGKRG